MKCSYALYQSGKRISKWYPHKQQAVTDAYERGLVYYGSGKLWPACEIKTDLEVMHEQQQKKEGE